MKDATSAARLERAIATLEIILGRLERLTGPFQAGALNLPESPATPPIDSKWEEEIDKIAKDRYKERQAETYLEDPNG